VCPRDSQSIYLDDMKDTKKLCEVAEVSGLWMVFFLYSFRVFSGEICLLSEATEEVSLMYARHEVRLCHSVSYHMLWVGTRRCVRVSHSVRTCVRERARVICFIPMNEDMFVLMKQFRK